MSQWQDLEHSGWHGELGLLFAETIWVEKLIGGIPRSDGCS